MAVPSPHEKTKRREEALQRRRAHGLALAPETRAALEARLAEIVVPQLIGARMIALYHPLRDEISPYPIADALAGGPELAFPWFADRDSRMTWKRGPVAEAGPWGISQPAACSDPVAPDLVLVPLVLADRSGTRIGHGKGHYDRALAHLRDSKARVFTIGLGWDFQISDEKLPHDPWDMPLDALATPKEWIDCRWSPDGVTRSG